MTHFKVQSNFSSLYFDVEGFVLVSNTTKEEIEQNLQDFVNEIDEDEEFFFSDCDTLDEIPDMDGFTIVELSEEEFNIINKMFGGRFGLFIGPDFG